MPHRIGILLVSVVALLVGSTGSAQADAKTQLPFANGGGAWLAVDPAGSHVFVSGGPGTSSIVVLNYAGAVVKTITGEGGASQMALDPATHTLYVALHDATAISEIDTQTLTESTRFSTAPYPGPSSLVLAGGKLWFTCFQGSGSGCPGVVSADLDGSNMAVAGAPVTTYADATTLAAGGAGNKYLAVGGQGSSVDVDVYDVSGATPTLVSHVNDPNGSSGVRDLTFDPSGDNLLLACGAPYYVESLATSTLLSSAQYPTGPYPISVAVTADGKFVAGGIDTNSGPDVFVYPVGDTAPVRTIQVGDDSLTGVNHSLAFSPDAAKLFAVTTDAMTGHLAFHVVDLPTIPLKPSTTSMKPARKTVQYGHGTSLKIVMTGPASGKVDLYNATQPWAKQLIATATIRSHAATFTVSPKVNTTYSAEFEQGAGWAASSSRDVRIGVAPIVTVTTRPNGTVQVQGRRVSKTLLTGKVKPKQPRQLLRYVIQRRVGSRWRGDIDQEFLTGNNGVAHVIFFTARPGLCRVQVIYAGDTNYARSASAWKTFRAR